MAGNVDLGDQLDAELVTELSNVSEILGSVDLVLLESCIVSDKGEGGQLDVHGVVIGQMQMEHVDLEEGEQVDQFF